MEKSKLWFFDFISPFAYLQWTRLKGKVLFNDFEKVPVFFGGILQQYDHKGPAEIPSKRLMTYRHCYWIAEANKIPFKIPDVHPFLPLKALRLCIAGGSTNSLINDIFTAIWQYGEDINDDQVLLRIANNAGVDLAATKSNHIKEQLKFNTQKAVDLGVFGVPSLVINSQLFWGMDMTDMALAYMNNPKLFDTEQYQRLNNIENGLINK